MGGSSYVYLKNQEGLEKVKSTLLTLPGVDRVLTRAEAINQFDLMPERMGDLMVLGSKKTVFSTLENNESEKLDAHYRSHGSLYEASVPILLYNARNAPESAYFSSN